MKWVNIKLFVLHFWRNTTSLKTFYILYIIFIVLIAYSAFSGIKNHTIQNDIRQTHQKKARQSWEANPDKHPHRMAHFGTFAFRISPALGIFNYGIESYTGSTVFLEAHKQNSINFSEATFATGTLRFGEFNLALLLELVLPLILFFIGFSSISADRQNNTLKIILSQGATWKELLFGKSLGLFIIAQLFFIPVILVVICAFLFIDGQPINSSDWLRLVIISLGYLLFFFIISALTIITSARSRTSKNALLRLLGIWLLFVVLLPKSAQAIGSHWFPTPTKLAFQSAIEEDVIKNGDSHDPDDPHYNKLRDSVLKVHNVTKVTDLPFNYSGFVMREGEKISSKLYKKHYKDLIQTYNHQNNVTQLSALVNPFTAIKQLSMVISGTGFSAYIDFQKQADTYRYNLAQTMNELQMEYISSKASGSEGKVNVIDHEHWSAFSDFTHQPMSFNASFKNAFWGLLSILLWGIVALSLLVFTSKNAKAL